jgi:protein-S-isoprenylcysteine O-methyltransferase Ste14
MPPPASPQVQSQQSDPDTTTRIGRWLFRYRTAVPLPIAIAVLTLRIGETAPDSRLLVAGMALTAAGELVRLWAVRHIGTISRTRSERLGPLVTSGPFALVRNPLYVGNIALWTGFAMAARLVWLAPAVIVLLGAEYHAIVRWEERLLESRLGETYRAYAARVPRWFPGSTRWTQSSNRVPVFSWRDTLFSERGTLVAIVVGYVLIWLKTA